MTIQCEVCPVCDGPIKQWVKGRGEDGVIYNIDKCINCSFAFVNPRLTFSEMQRKYTSLGRGRDKDITFGRILENERLFPNSTIDAKRIATNFSLLLEKDKKAPWNILDVGCGYGFFSKEAKQKGFTVDFLEIGTERASVAKFISGINPIRTSFEEFVCRRKYRAVLLSQVLEHAVDFNQWISKVYNLLLPGGWVCIAVPNFSNIFNSVLKQHGPSVWLPFHLNYFTIRSIRVLLEKHGFLVRNVYSIKRIPRTFLERFSFLGISKNQFSKIYKWINLGFLDRLSQNYTGAGLWLSLTLEIYAEKIT